MNEAASLVTALVLQTVPAACPVWGDDRTPWVHRGIDASDPFQK
jgi:hypothetical protein